MLSITETSISVKREHEIIDGIIESLLDFLVQKLSIPGGDLLFEFLLSGVRDYLELPSGDELLLNNDGSVFVEKYLFQMNDIRKTLQKSRQENKSLYTRLDKAQSRVAFLEHDIETLKGLLSDFKTLKKVIRIADTNFRSKVSDQIDLWLEQTKDGRLDGTLYVHMKLGIERAINFYGKQYSRIINNF